MAEKLQLECEALKAKVKTADISKLQPNLFEVKPLAEKRLLKGHIRKIQEVTWHKDSSRLIAADQGGKVIVWDAKSGAKVKLMSKSFVMACALNPSNEQACIGGMDNMMYYYECAGEDAEAKLVRQLDGHDGYVSSIKFLSATEMLSAGGDAEIFLWDLNRFTPTLKFRGHETDAGCIRTPSDAGGCNAFATASSDGSVRVWDLRTGKCTHLFKTSDECNSCAFFPNGMAVAAGSNDGKAQLFDLRSYGVMQTMARKNNRVAAVDFSKSGRTLFAAYEDGHVCSWDTFGKTGTYTHKLNAHASSGGTQRIISTMAMAPDGSALATGAFDALVKVWSVAASTKLKV